MDDACDTMTADQSFEHEPLDPASSSIRLVRIQSQRNSDERIECYMRLASLEEEYTCLSYVWGTADHGQCVFVNGKELFVHYSLWNFLNQASSLSQLKSRWFWIDAICINQSDVHERQHQVQQMGRIYSGAKEVISWLGTSPSIAGFLSELQLARDANPSYWLAFAQYAYWKRAWITQEFVLARKIKLMACDQLSSFSPRLHPGGGEKKTRPWKSDVRVPSNMPKVFATRDLRWRHKAQDNRKAEVWAQSDTLLQLLDDHGHKDCQLRRDKIFALLGLCSDVRHLEADYSISHADLALNVLQSRAMDFCLCTLSLIAKTLDLNSLTHAHTGGIPTVFVSKLRGAVSLPIKWHDTYARYLFGDDTQAWQIGLVPGAIKASEHIWPGQITIYELTEITIRIDLVKICPHVVGNVWIRYRNNTCICSYEETTYWLGIEWPMDDATRLEVSDEGQCSLSFSMDFWLFLTSRVRREKFGRDKCCPRIYRYDTSSKTTSTYPGVQLLEANLGSAKRFRAPSEVEKFVRCVTAIGLEQDI